MGKPQNYALAKQWCGRAEAQGESAGAFNLGRMYLEGWGVRSDIHTAMRWFEQSAAQGNQDAQVMLGKIYYRGMEGVLPNRAVAIGWFEKAMAQGDDEARRILQDIRGGGE